MTILITGAAGFVGSRLAIRLLEAGEDVVGIDNFDPYYDPAIKRGNIAAIHRAAPTPRAFTLIEGDICNFDLLEKTFQDHSIRRVAHMAAMSGVRYSAERAPLYATVNVVGGANVLEAARRHQVEIVVQGSTSNVYGESARLPFSEHDPAVAPLAPYPASKRAAELFAHSYHHLHGLNTTVLRFFNVYGPHGRPDMMPIRTLKAILNDQPIQAFGGGELKRDWTYIDDILDGIIAALNRPLGFEILNLGCGFPISLLDFIHIYEKLIGKSAIVETAPMPATEVPITYCDNSRARELLGFAPKVQIEEGLARTWAWYQAEMQGS